MRAAPRLAALGLLCWTVAVPAAVAASAAGRTHWATGAPAQDEVLVSGRVTAVLGPRELSIDRGQADGLEVGDEVQLLARDGARTGALVVRCGERDAVVEVLVEGGVHPPGTRLESWLPATRFAPEGPEAPVVEPAPEEGSPAEPPASRWSNADEGWRDGLPLLAGLDPVRPAERAPRFGGRIYAGSDRAVSNEQGRGSYRLRAGTDLWYDNWLGRGEELRLDLEWNHRQVQLPDQADEADTSFRVDRLSYAEGGHRFAPLRYEVGRFLQRGLPEFGVLDGVEWVRRREGGDSYGASLGFLPEPDLDYESGEDLALSTFYRWVQDPSETLAAAVGYQKTWHNLEADRDLLLAKVHYLPPDAWTLDATAWVDVYTSGDELQGPGLGLTQAYGRFARRYGRAGGLDFSYSHLEFPETLRDEFPQELTPFELDDSRRDRLAAAGWLGLLERAETEAEVGVWADEDDEGADALVGVALSDAFGRSSRIGFQVFATDGEFTTVLGGRVTLGLPLEALRLDLLYELSQQDQKGFADNNDDFLQHRGRVALGLLDTRGLSLSAYADATFWNSERGLFAGVLAQWSF
jgi:hypothetical protein